MAGRRRPSWWWRILLAMPAVAGWLLLLAPSFELRFPVGELVILVLRDWVAIGPVWTPYPDLPEVLERVTFGGFEFLNIDRWEGIVLLADWLVAAASAPFVIPLLNGMRLKWRRSRRRRLNRCEVCGYSLRGQTSERCPECGGDVALRTE